MTRKSKRELERAIESLQADTDIADAVPMVVPETALVPGDRPNLDVPIDDEDIRETVDRERIELQLPYHRPPGVLSADGIPLITEAEVALLWNSLPDEVRTAERELREERDDPIPAVLRGGA